jgi:hypothetical protein
VRTNAQVPTLLWPRLFQGSFVQSEMLPIVQAAVRPSEMQKEMLGALPAVYGAMRMAMFPPFMPGVMRFGKFSWKDWDFLALVLICDCQICSRLPCDEVCEKRLKCGHGCPSSTCFLPRDSYLGWPLYVIYSLRRALRAADMHCMPPGRA